MITLWYDIPSIRNRNIYYRISYNIYRYSPFLQVNIFIWLIGERYDAISQVHCPCLRCARPKAMTFPQHHHSISNKTSKENGQILIKTAYSCYICQMFQHVSSNCINFKIWSCNFRWYTARPQTALKLIDRDGFCGQLGTPLCMSQQEGGKEINNELNRCSCHQLAERNPSILPPISVKITRISNY